MDEKALLAFLLKNYRIPKVRLDGFRIPQNLRSVIPGDMLRKYRMIPIDLVGDILCVAVEDIYSFSSEALDDVKKRTGYRVKIFSGDSNLAIIDRDHFITENLDMRQIKDLHLLTSKTDQ